MPKIILRPNPTPPPFVPPTPPISDNTIVFHGKNVGSLVTANYDYWNNYIKQNFEIEEGDNLSYLGVSWRNEEFVTNNVNIELNSSNEFIGYLDSEIEEMLDVDVQWSTYYENQGIIEDYNLIILD